MALRQIDLSQITAPTSANAQVLAVINGNVTYTNVATVYTAVTTQGDSVSSFLLMGA